MYERIPLYLGALVVSLGYGMLAPLAADLIENTESSVLVGVLIGIYPLAKAVGYAVCLIPQCRRWSHRLMLMLAAGIYAALGLSLFPPLIGLARCIEGFVFGWFLARASLEIAEAKEAVGFRLSWLNGMSAAGVLAGPVLIAVAAQVASAQMGFLVASGLCAIVAFLSIPASSPTKGAPSHGAVARSRLNVAVGVWALIGVFMLFDFTSGVLSLSIPVAFQALEADPVTGTAVVFSIGFLMFAGLMPVFGFLADRCNPIVMLTVSLLCIAALFTVLANVRLSASAFAGVLLTEYLMAAMAYASALAIIGRHHPGALPIIGITQSMAMAGGATISGYLAANREAAGSFALLSLLYLAIAAVSAALLALDRRREFSRRNVRGRLATDGRDDSHAIHPSRKE